MWRSERIEFVPRAPRAGISRHYRLTCLVEGVRHFIRVILRCELVEAWSRDEPTVGTEVAPPDVVGEHEHDVWLDRHRPSIAIVTESWL